LKTAKRNYGDNSYKPLPTDIHRPSGPAPNWEKGAPSPSRTPQGLPHGAECGGQARRGDTPTWRTCPAQRRGLTVPTGGAGPPGMRATNTPKGSPDVADTCRRRRATRGPLLRRAGCVAPQDARTGPPGRPPRRCRPGRRRRGARLPRSRRIGRRGAGATGCRGGGLVGGVTPSGCPIHETSRPDSAPRRGGARAPDCPHGG
jgi:hypothetical protein